VKIWDAESGELQRTLRGHTSRVTSVSYSPDGTRIASGSFDKTVKIWDELTGELKQTLNGHTDRVFSVSYSPDGTRIASGSGDKTVKIWVDTSIQEVHKVARLIDKQNEYNRITGKKPLPQLPKEMNLEIAGFLGNPTESDIKKYGKSKLPFSKATFYPGVKESTDFLDAIASRFETTADDVYMKLKPAFEFKDKEKKKNKGGSRTKTKTRTIKKRRGKTKTKTKKHM